MKKLFSILLLTASFAAFAQLPTNHPGTVTIGIVPEAEATDSILTINENGLFRHIPRSEIGGGELIKVDNGWRLNGYDSAKFRAIGNGSIDLTTTNGASPDSNYGVGANYGFSAGFENKVGAGDHHVTIGVGNTSTGTWNSMSIGADNTVGGYVSNFAIGVNNTVTQGYGTGAIGSYNTVNQQINGFGVAIGHNNALSDIATNALGTALISKSRYTVALGVANTNYPEAGNIASRPILAVGIGTTATSGGAWNATERKDGLIVRKNGVVQAPELTEALINADTTGRVLTTRDWVTENPPSLQEIFADEPFQEVESDSDVVLMIRDSFFDQYIEMRLSSVFQESPEIHIGNFNIGHTTIGSGDIFLKKGTAGDNEGRVRLEVEDTSTGGSGGTALLRSVPVGQEKTVAYVEDIGTPSLQQVFDEGAGTVSATLPSGTIFLDDGTNLKLDLPSTASFTIGGPGAINIGTLLTLSEISKPATPEPGTIIRDSADNQLKYYDGTDWYALDMTLD